MELAFEMLGFEMFWKSPMFRINAETYHETGNILSYHFKNLCLSFVSKTFWNTKIKNTHISPNKKKASVTTPTIFPTMLSNNLSRNYQKKQKKIAIKHTCTKPPFKSTNDNEKKHWKEIPWFLAATSLSKTQKRSFAKIRTHGFLGKTPKKNMKALLKREFLDRAPSCNPFAWNTKRVRFFQSFHVLAMHMKFNSTKPIWSQFVVQKWICPHWTGV